VERVDPNALARSALAAKANDNQPHRAPKVGRGVPAEPRPTHQPRNRNVAARLTGDGSPYPPRGETLVARGQMEPGRPRPGESIRARRNQHRSIREFSPPRTDEIFLAHASPHRTVEGPFLR